MRLQKYIASAGVCSRREAEERIRQGRVTINGAAASLGDSAEEGDIITVDGVPVTPVQSHTYVMLHKPRGYVTTLQDEKGRKTVADLVAGIGVRLFPVGRLDLQSEGLLIMTDDGALANALMHPSHEAEKVYRVWVHGADLVRSAEKMRQPVVWDGITYHADKVSVLRDDLLEIIVHEGKNHEVRNICAAVGLKVERLLRVQHSGLSLGDLPAGKWRYLTEKEIDLLKNGG